MSGTRYLATVNTPGYLPDGDGEPYLFDNPGDAWGELADQRRREEDAAEENGSEYSVTVHELDAYAVSGHGEGTVYGCTPGGRMHDLGRAYSVTAVTVDDSEVAQDNPEAAWDGDLPGDGAAPWWAQHARFIPAPVVAFLLRRVKD